MKREDQEKVDETTRGITITQVAEDIEVALLRRSETDHGGIVAEMRITMDPMRDGTATSEGVDTGIMNPLEGIDGIEKRITAGGVVSGRTRNHAAVRLVGTEAGTATAVGDKIVVTNPPLDAVLAHRKYSNLVQRVTMHHQMGTAAPMEKRLRDTTDLQLLLQLYTKPILVLNPILWKILSDPFLPIRTTRSSARGAEALTRT
jgi:hypothetical protein